jgi:hypothetical protein
MPSPIKIVRFGAPDNSILLLNADIFNTPIFISRTGGSHAHVPYYRVLTDTWLMAYACKECGQTYLNWEKFDKHVNKHLQKHLDEFSLKIPEKKTPSQVFSNIPEGMNRELLKVFERYNLANRSMLCLWRNGYLSCALRDRSREQELQTRLKEWLNA